ncbi:MULTISPECIES: HD domain-containing protein [Pelosinus]|uniref:Metal-dependent phosphohydrolase HD sub domain-containing protein n=1 Tax=Pelosinus fermentans B4 TaxID=1149862 RepID=I9LHS5_9FIRM|nr:MULTISPECIES: TraI domain-containing protein [Pelosinus]EIW19936.1 metal-dependent phosphohydrolase HD sub domain-containing protein [Pelosinus fermentans B4]EIW21207.1 hypothetical protein FA11_0934 [Pelosinus fermentans A11]
MKNKFTALLLETGRPGIEQLIAHLETTDFFTAPASTRHHGAHAGGLLEHSLQVYEHLLRQATAYPDKLGGYSRESLILAALLHDICKADYYVVEMRNAKNEQEKWVKVPFYTVNEKLPFGHGQKSVIIALQFIHLTPDEIAAILWHMGGFDDQAKTHSFGKAYSMYPLCLALHAADMAATYYDGI